MRPHVGMFVSSATIGKHGACRGYRKKLRDRFPNGVRVNAKLCERYAQTWNWDWAGEHLLNPEGQVIFKSIREVLRRLNVGRVFDGATPLNPIRIEHGMSNRAYNVALASLFGGLAQQKKYDPAFFQ